MRQNHVPGRRTDDQHAIQPTLETLEDRWLLSVSPALLAGGIAVPPQPAIQFGATALAAPSGLTATAASPVSVSLSWTGNAPGAAGYQVQRSLDGVNFTNIATVASASTTTYTDNAAVAGRANYYRVRCFSGATVSAFSGRTMAVTPVLAVPSGLSATANSPISVSLSWTNNDNAATGYAIQRSSAGSAYKTIATISGAGTTTWTDNTALAGALNSYRVCALAATSASAYSVVASVTAPAMAAPSDLSVTANAPTNVSLSWANNETVAAGFTIQRSLDNRTFITIAVLNSGVATTYTDTTAASGKINYYRVRAIAGSSASAFGTAASVQTPMAASTGLLANALTAFSVKLTWGVNDPSTSGLRILRSTAGGDFVTVATLARVLTWTDTTVSPSTTYQYKVEAYNAAVTANTSMAATAITPLGPATGVTATLTGLTQVTVRWTNSDATNATGLYILRSLDGKTYTRLATLSDPTTTSYADDAVATGGTYFYIVQAFASGGSTTAYAAGSAAVKAVVPVGAATDVSTTVNGPKSVTLNWSEADTSITGFKIYRSLDNKTFSLVATLNLPLATSHTDTTAASGKKYYYRVQAFKGAATATITSTVTAITPLAAPANFTATAIGLSVKLTWTSADASATGYRILRSLDNITFTQVAAVASTATTLTDAGLTGDLTYYYQVQAYNSVAASAASSASATPNGTSVSVATRYGNELVITAFGSNDTISISQSGSTMTILADGRTTTMDAPGAGVFIYTRGGASTISIDSSVVARTTVETIDASNSVVNSAGTNVSFWVDSTDTVTGSGAVHRVASFAGGVSKLTGVALKNPTDAGTTKKVLSSLWGTGPVITDVNQGSVGDCYFLSSLAGFAWHDAASLRESAVDMGDGTFAVQFFNASGVGSFVRVSNDLTTGYFSGGLKFAHPGASGSIWAAIMEKAFCYYRTGANTYASIAGGWMGSVYTNLGVSSTWFDPRTKDDASLYAQLSAALDNGPVTLGTSSAPPNLVGGHAYTLVSVSTDGSGNRLYTVRNPWGSRGGNAEDSSGYATLTSAQMKANFTAACVAV